MSSTPKPLFTLERFDKYAIGNLLILALIVTTLTGLTYAEPVFNLITNDEFDDIDDDSGGALLACIVITISFLILATISYIIYKLLSWLEKRCECNGCSWKKPWNCGCKLFCWIVTVTKWVARIVNIATTLTAYITFVICLFGLL